MFPAPGAGMRGVVLIQMQGCQVGCSGGPVKGLLAFHQLWRQRVAWSQSDSKFYERRKFELQIRQDLVHILLIVSIPRSPLHMKTLSWVRTASRKMSFQIEL